MRIIRKIIGLRQRLEAALLERNMALQLGGPYLAAALVSDLITMVRRWWNHKREPKSE